MLVVLHTVLLASETKQHCGRCLWYSTDTCCQADKTGGYSKSKLSITLVFVLNVNLVCYELNFLLILRQHVVRFVLEYEAESQSPTVFLCFPQLTIAEMNFLERLPTSMTADHL